MEMVKSEEAIVVQIEPRKNSRVCCSGCGRTASGYDHMSEARHFEFVPLWGMKVYFRYRMRRVNCRRCGVKVEEVPWAKGKSHLSWPMQWFLGPVGEALELGRDGKGFSHELAQRLRVGRGDGALGAQTARYERD